MESLICAVLFGAFAAAIFVFCVVPTLWSADTKESEVLCCEDDVILLLTDCGPDDDCVVDIGCGTDVDDVGCVVTPGCGIDVGGIVTSGCDICVEGTVTSDRGADIDGIVDVGDVTVVVLFFVLFCVVGLLPEIVAPS